MYAEKLYLPVLVLNKNWNPIGTTPLYRAINLLISYNKNKIKKAEVIDAYSIPFTWEEWSKTKPCSERKAIPCKRDSLRT